MAKTRTPKEDDDEKTVEENIQKRFKNMFSGPGEPLSNMSLQEVESLKTRIAQLEKELVQESETTLVAKSEKRERGLSPSPLLPKSFASNPNVESRSLFSNALSNISMRWKMGLMVFVFLLAMMGITTASHVGLQALRYHLSNIYDFMLIPILAISEADTALADSQYHFENLDEVTGKELTESIEHIQANTQLAAEIISRYDTEWVTTTSPEFTQALREAGKLELQQQEVASLESFHAAFDAAQEAGTKYLATARAGSPDTGLAEEVDEALNSARVQLEKLININNEFASLSNSQAQAAYSQAFITTLLVFAISIIFVSFASYLIVVSITNRLGILTRSAAAMQEGKLDQFVSIAGRDEVSLLGSTFNAMARRLKDLFTTMEQRVQDRTHDLELASEVGRTVSEKVENLESLLSQAVELIRARFNLYYTQVYLVDPVGQTITLRAGTGDVGKELVKRGHQLLMSTASLNGRAVVEKRSIIVADTKESPTFLPNPLLPYTRAEMSIPLIVGEKVVGVLDMQSEQPAALNETNLPAFEALAGQLAIAIQNAALLTQAEEARATVEAQIHHLTEHGWQEFLDAIDRGQKIGFEFKKSQIVRLEPDALLTSSEDLSIPITVTGTKIGEIHIPVEQDHAWMPHELELIKATSAQLAQHIENLRLLAQAERYRAEAEQAIRRLTREGWENYQQLRADEAPGYLFNLVDVQPLTATSNGHVPAALKHPLSIRGETIGELAVDGLDHQAEATEIITAVAEQLSQHVENLRLAEETEKRSSELATVAGQLSEALDIARLANWEYDVARDRFIFNDHFYSIFHTTVEEVGGYEISSAEYAARFVHPDDVPMVGQEIGKALSSTDRHYNVHLEHRILFTDGGVGHISVDVHIERDEQGNILRYYGANQDITERKKAEEILRVSEARLSEALDIAKLANWEYDLERDVFTFNDQFYSIFHTTADKVGGYELSSAQYAQLFVHPDDAALVGEEIGKAIASTDRHSSAEIEHRCLFADGGVGYMSVVVNIERDENGKITRWYGANQDITERKQAEQIITQRATQLATVANLSSTTSTLLDPDKLLQTVVDLTKERFGLYHAHIYLADESWNTLLLAAGADEVGRQMVAEGWNIPMDHEQSIVARAARARQSVIANDVVRDKSSSFLSNQLLADTRSEMAVPMIVGQKLLGVFDVQADQVDYFTEEDANIYTTLAAQVAIALQNARLYVEQAATVTQLRELDKLKSSFLANMSHELRTPLNSILGFTDVMLEELDGPLTEHMDNDLRLIQKNGQHLLHLINDVLDMAKIEAGRMNLSPENFKAFDVMEEVTSITSTLASEKNLALFIDETSEQDLEIYADRTRLRQVMINLVNNAIKFTEAGKVSLKVTSLPGARVLITVKDTGIGIAPDKLDAIFLEFTQVDSSSTRKAGGTGLGLPISRRLVEMHGGRLWAESTGIPGEGSTFFVELPIEARISEVVEKQAS